MTDTLVGKLVCPAPFRSPRVDCRPAPFGSAPSRSDSASAPRRGLVRAARAAGWSGWPRAAPAPGVVYLLAHRLEHQLKPARTGLLISPPRFFGDRGKSHDAHVPRLHTHIWRDLPQSPTQPRVPIPRSPYSCQRALQPRFCRFPRCLYFLFGAVAAGTQLQRGAVQHDLGLLPMGIPCIAVQSGCGSRL